MNKTKFIAILVMGISMVGTSLTGYALDAKTESRQVIMHDKNMQYSDFATKSILKNQHVQLF